MPEVVACPHCKNKLRVPDALVGKKVKCPTCHKPFDAGVAASRAAEPPVDELEEVRGSPKSREDDGGAYEVIDEPEKRRRRSRDDERIQSRSGRRRIEDDEEEDDRPSRRRRRFEEDDDDDDDEEDYRPSRRRRRLARADWPRIHKGLTLVLASVITQILLALVMLLCVFVFIGGAASAASGGKGSAAGAGAAVGGLIFAAVVYLLGLFAALVMRIVGHAFCLPSPVEHGAKGLALATLLCIAGNVACSIFSILVSIAGSGMSAAASNPFGFGAASGASQALNLLGGLLAFAGAVLFLFYMRALALVLGAHGLARSIVSYMITVAVSVGVGVALFCVFAAVMAGSMASIMGGGQNAGAQGSSGLAAVGALGLVFGCIAVVGALALFIWWIMLLVQVRAVVATRAGR
jgi:hypothetical protein